MVAGTTTIPVMNLRSASFNTSQQRFPALARRDLLDIANSHTTFIIHQTLHYYVSQIRVLETPRSPTDVDAILHPVIREWFHERFSSFSLPQLFGVIPVHSRENVLISAPTGATKTLTGFLSVLNELVDSSTKGVLENRVYCVYISPLKALNNDIAKNLLEPLSQMGILAKRDLGIRVAVRTGDTSTTERQKMSKTPPHILVTTPESLAILLCSPKFREYLRNVQWCIIDEVHALAENKRGVHLSLSLERLQYLSPGMCRVGLSATVAPIEEVAKFLVGSTRSCNIIDVQFLKNMDLQVMSPVPDLIETDHLGLHTAMYQLIDDLVSQHRTTLIFTNTRSATERVVDHLKFKFPKKYAGLIGAHHGSLGKEARHNIEEQLRLGKLKCVVSSTSLELGIDIGYIDLVLCLGSPKSVARFLQRAGRSGHRLNQTVNARLIVMDRDDLVECAVLVKAARERKIDKLHIPTNCLDVLAQQIIGMAIEQVWNEEELFGVIRNSYCYSNLSRSDFADILKYLAGEFVSLEERHIYARIWRNDGMIGKRGKLARVIYMTNVGTIPDETFITVKVGDHIVGTLDEQFLERLRAGDVFVLGGETYQFRFARGTVAQVTATTNRPPTVPSWISEMLPLSFDLSLEIGKFRRLLAEKFHLTRTRNDTISFIREYLEVNDTTAIAIHHYFSEQYAYAKRIPSDTLVLLEHVKTDTGTKVDSKIVFHALFGRRVNDCLSRGIAFVCGKVLHKDVEIGMNDNGFFVSGITLSDAKNALHSLEPAQLRKIMEIAIETSEVYRRRFRHCATRSFMILRNYLGTQKHVGRQQVGSQILMSALKRISNDFTILREAKRECLEDLMDIENTKFVLEEIKKGTIRIDSIDTRLPTPFAFSIAFQGSLDVLRIEEKHEFLKRMHQMVLAKIGKTESPPLPGVTVEDFEYNSFWEAEQEKKIEEKSETRERLKHLIWNLEDTPVFIQRQIGKILEGEDVHQEFEKELAKIQEQIKKWPEEVQKIVREFRERKSNTHKLQKES